jgi:organic radical activating enzyme
MAEKIVCSMVNHGLGVTWDGLLTPCCSWEPKKESHKFFWDNYQGYNDTIRTLILKDFDQGIQHAGCIKCFREEELRYGSLRQLANREHPQTHETPSIHNPIYNFELRLGNNCNLRCIMCGPYASSSWHLERAEHKEKFDEINIINAKEQPTKWWENTDFYNFLSNKFKDAIVVDISGGEPLPLPGTQKMLDLLISSGNTKLDLRFNTNLTRVPKAFLEKLKLFSNTGLSVSLEGTGAMNNYLRYPSKWEEINNNLIHVQNVLPGAIRSVNHTLQHASVYSLPDLINYVKERKIALYMTTVYGNACLTPASVPPKDLKRLSKWIEQQDWLLSDEYKHWGTGVYTIIKTMCKKTVFNPDLYKEYRKYVELLDSIRGTDYDATFNPSSVVIS